MDEFEVQVTGEAARDLEELCEYVADRDSAQASSYVYERIKAAILKLATAPLRGRVIPELEGVGVLHYREVFFKPYRIQYFVEGSRVYVFAVVDGRRDLEPVIRRRLLHLPWQGG